MIHRYFIKEGCGECREAKDHNHRLAGGKEKMGISQEKKVRQRLQTDERMLGRLM